MRLPPPEVLLSWPAPNYTDPVTRGNTLVIVNVVLISFTVMLVAARLYTRLCVKVWFGLDDVFIFLALIFAGGLTAAVLLANQHYGWDRHVYDIPLTKLKPTLQIAMAAKLLFTAAATFTRLSLFCFYYRLLKDTSKGFYVWVVHANVVYTICIFVTFVFLIVFLCTPVSMYWTYGAPEGNCLNEGTATLIAGIINVIADFACTVTPIPMVMSLKMPRRQRFAVIVLFSLGFFVTAAGSVRTYYIYESLVVQYDTTWYAYPLWIAAAIEIDLGVICASAPVLRPLLAKLHLSFSSIGTTGKNSTRDTEHFRSLPGGDAHTVSTDRRSMLWFKTDSRPLSRVEKGELDAYEMDARQGSAHARGQVDPRSLPSSPAPASPGVGSMVTETNCESGVGGSMGRAPQHAWPSTETHIESGARGAASPVSEPIRLGHTRAANPVSRAWF
ncbi:hypothetical protein DPSP01_007680 [Paraphaeosphaeria sporulosa]